MSDSKSSLKFISDSDVESDSCDLEFNTNSNIEFVFGSSINLAPHFELESRNSAIVTKIARLERSQLIGRKCNS